MEIEAGQALRTATVVEFVVAQASRFNSLQHPEIFWMLYLKDFCEERRGEHLVPSQIQNLIEAR